MSQGRPRAVAAVMAIALAGGATTHLLWPSSKSALDCAPDEVHLGTDGVARCGPGLPLNAGAKLTLGVLLDLNRATAGDLAQLPGVGPQLAKAIIDDRTRLGGFKSWDEVDAVPGVGPARIETLKAVVEIR